MVRQVSEERPVRTAAPVHGENQAVRESLERTVNPETEAKMALLELRWVSQE